VTDLLATPSIVITRIHGKHTYIERFTGAIRADYREESVGDSGYKVPQELCPCCHGCGQTPAGEPISEEQARLVSRGVIVVCEDSDPCALETCRHCNGSGTVDEDTDPDDFDEYRFIER
jgi:hypothetical protein